MLTSTTLYFPNVHNNFENYFTNSKGKLDNSFTILTNVKFIFTESMSSNNFRPQILVICDLKENIVSPFTEILDGRKTSKYFNGCTKIADVKKHLKESFYGGSGSVEGFISWILYLKIV